MYSIFRSSLDAVPTVKRVTDLKLGSSSGGEKGFVGTIESSTQWHAVTQGNIYVSMEGDGSYSSLSSLDSYKGEFSPQGIKGTYWRFTKEEFPYLIVRYTDKETKKDKCITWGDAVEIYIPEGEITGGSGPSPAYKILSVGGAFNICASDAIYSDPLADFGILDDGSTGDVIDPSSLLYVGGETITASTIASKDGTLFLGNVSISRPSISSSVKKSIKGLTITCDTRSVTYPSTMYGAYYKWGNTLNACHNWTKKLCTNIAGFKWREHYRLGV